MWQWESCGRSWGPGIVAVRGLGYQLALPVSSPRGRARAVDE